MKSLLVILLSSSLLASLPAHAEEIRELAPPRPRPVKYQELSRPIERPATPKWAPIPTPYVIGDYMTSDEVLAIATSEYAQLAKLIGEYGRRPEFAALENAADAHFAEGTRRLGAEVKAALQGGAVGETPEEAFRRDVEALGREVADALSKGSIGLTPEEQFRADVEKLGKEVADLLSKGSIGPTPPTFEQEVEALANEVRAILSQGSIGTNAPRYSQTTPAGGAKPAAGTATGKAIGAGMARD